MTGTFQKSGYRSQTLWGSAGGTNLARRLIAPVAVDGASRGPSNGTGGNTAAIDDLMLAYHSGAGVMTRRCTLCELREVWRRISRNAEHNRREGSRSRAKMLQHIKAEHPDAYAAALDHDRRERPQRAEARARWQEERARMTPYELGTEAFWSCMRAAERSNVWAGMLDSCPFKKGTPEEAEYDRGWQAARQQHAAVSG